MATSENPIAPLSLTIPDELRRRPARVSLVKRVVRFSFHVYVMYLVVEFGTSTVPTWLTSKIFRAIFSTTAADPVRLLFSHFFLFAVAPAIILGLLLNARFGHGVARMVWIVPTIILALAFLFRGPGLYPTMIWDSDFGQAFRYFFGAFQFSDQGSNSSGVSYAQEVFRAYAQLRLTGPAYTGIAYSVGAAIGMSGWCRGLQVFLQKF